MPRNTKIIVTVGPAMLKPDVFKKIAAEGVDFLRINTAYSTNKQHNDIFCYLKDLKKEDSIGIIYDVRKVKDLSGIKFRDNDLAALSFAQTKKQLDEAVKLAPGVNIISKIESKKGLENFQEVIENSWGVMVARGDLGEAVSLEKVPCAQKKLSKMILENKKFLIVATEMLLSMVRSQRPTRAEVSDVANAVFEGANAVMLSEETAIGKYPLQAVAYMKKVIIEAEKCLKNGIGF